MKVVEPAITGSVNGVTTVKEPGPISVAEGIPGGSEFAGWGLYGTRIVKELGAYFFPSWRRQFERGSCVVFS
jgi:hypothetical protein